MLKKKLLIYSLYPLHNTGGGEYFTLNTALAAAAFNDQVDLYCPALQFPDEFLPLPPLENYQLVSVLRNSVPDVSHKILFKDFLSMLPEYETIWLQQYLSNSGIYALLANIASDQQLLLTSHGHEPQRDVFLQLYQPNPRHAFVEVSPFSRMRVADKIPGNAKTFTMSAGISLNQINESKPVPGLNKAEGPRLCAVGRGLPHKGFETIIRAMPDEARLTIIGPVDPDSPYQKFLNELAQGKPVTFTGRLPENEKLAIMADSDLLIAASTHKLYDGRTIEQAELLGLVILEGIINNLLPIVSDIPPFRWIMEETGLGEYVFPEGDNASLRKKIEKATHLTIQEKTTLLRFAKKVVADNFSWETYWPRVCHEVDV